MVPRVAVGKAAGSGVMLEGSIGGHQDKVSGTIVETPATR